jgi:hypothetical protein
MATAITRRTLFQRGEDVLEFVERPDIQQGAGKAYRVILNGTAVDWAYNDCHTVKSAKTAEYFFSKHVDGIVR